MMSPLLVVIPIAALAGDEPAAWCALALACALAGPLTRLRRHEALGEDLALLFAAAAALAGQVALDALYPASRPRHEVALLAIATVLLRPAISCREALRLALALAALRAAAYLAGPGSPWSALSSVLPLALLLHPGGVALAATLGAVVLARGEER